jgi:galactose mutarotase-like enzyme
VLTLAAGRWDLAVIPERGGRIASLRLDGEELLDQGIGVDQPTAKGFVEGGAWGWDEMVPNVEATDALPDHGEAWRLPWSIVATGNNSLGLSCEGKVVPWRLGRQIFLEQGVSVRYRYTNNGAQPHYAYWCAHPLFKFEPQMEVSVPVPRVPEGSSAKVFLPKGSVDRVALRWASGTALELVWDPVLTPYLGIWICNGDLGGYRQIAIEPATGGNDRPDPAAPPPLLAPGESFEWWLQIRAL